MLYFGVYFVVCYVVAGLAVCGDCSYAESYNSDSAVLFFGEVVNCYACAACWAEIGGWLVVFVGVGELEAVVCHSVLHYEVVFLGVVGLFFPDGEDAEEISLACDCVSLEAKFAVFH